MSAKFNFFLASIMCLSSAGTVAVYAADKLPSLDIETKSEEKVESKKLKKLDFSKSPKLSLVTERTKSVKFATPDPKTALQFNNRGVELGSKGFFLEAIANHRKACELDPKVISFRTNLSACSMRYAFQLLKNKKTEQAEVWFKEALKADSNNKVAQKKLDEIKEAG